MQLQPSAYSGINYNGRYVIRAGTSSLNGQQERLSSLDRLGVRNGLLTICEHNTIVHRYSGLQSLANKADLPAKFVRLVI